jgi:hypothetical protein
MKSYRHPIPNSCARVLLSIVFVGICSQANAVFNKRFDTVTFCCPCTVDKHICQAQFDELNWRTNSNSKNGHMLMMGNDDHRSEVNNNGNFLGAYYNDLTTGWTTMTGAQKADDIENNYIIPLFARTGVKTKWILINEISAGTWPNNQTYRTWVGDCMACLKNTYAHEVLLFSPFASTQSNDADWQRVSSYAYIVIELYLSGAEVNASGNSISWCQTQYQNAKNSYMARGIPAAQLYLAEHFAQSVSGTGWGRAGVSYAGWDNAIYARAAGARNCNFAGFVSYAWGDNGMQVSDTDLIHFEHTYNLQTLP